MLNERLVINIIVIIRPVTFARYSIVYLYGEAHVTS